MSTPFMVTVQTNSQEEMDALTALIDADAEATGASRHVLGAIEATSSRVRYRRSTISHYSDSNCTNFIFTQRDCGDDKSTSQFIKMLS